MSLAAETRRAADANPFLVHALRAGVCNYTAAARFLDVDGDVDAVATALRRYAEDLTPLAVEDRDARVTMRSGVGPVSAPEEALLVVGEIALGDDGGELTAILGTGSVDGQALATVIGRFAVEDVAVRAAAYADGTIVVVVDRRDGANALRAVERALGAVPA